MLTREVFHINLDWQNGIHWQHPRCARGCFRYAEDGSLDKLSHDKVARRPVAPFQTRLRVDLNWLA